MLKLCLICDNPVIVRHISRLNRTKYCSFKCKYESYKKERNKIICRHCGIEYLAYPSQIKRVFCSKKCRYEWQSSGKWPLNFYRTATHDQIIERLIQYLDQRTIKNNGCWQWIAKKDKDGYGIISANHPVIKRAHRASWIVNNGQINDGLWVLHKCDNPECTNPEHLYLGTAQNNNDDMVNKGRSRPVKGLDHPFCNLTKDQIIKIKELLSQRVSQYKIAEEFGVSQQTISRINTKQTYKDM